MSIKRFGGLVAYITGGSSGIGLAIAGALAARGAHLVLLARNRKRLDAALQEVESSRIEASQRFAAETLDVTRRKEAERVLGRAVGRYGVPNILVNCAGLSRPDYFENVSQDQFEDILKTNLHGTWNTCSVLVPLMRREGEGAGCPGPGAGCPRHIVNVASVAGLLPVFGYSDYAAAKAGVIALSRVLRSELRPHGIGVSVLLPTDTDTPGFAEENRTKPPETRAVSSWSKVAPPERMAEGLIKGLKRGRFLIIPTALDRLFWLVERLAPRLVDAVTDMDVRRVHRGRMREREKEVGGERDAS